MWNDTSNNIRGEMCVLLFKKQFSNYRLDQSKIKNAPKHDLLGEQ